MHRTVKPEIITWARERAGMKLSDLADKFPHLSSWEDGSVCITTEESIAFARAVHFPFGYLLRDKPRIETFPISDFRSFSGGNKPSLKVRDTVRACGQLKGWYWGHLLDAGQEKLDFVGSAKLNDDPKAMANGFATRLGLSALRKQRKRSNLDRSFQLLRQMAVDAGVLVVVNDQVMNSSRFLSAEEFSGFALSHEYAPLVFVNSADSISGQIYTLAHELGHILLGKSALDDASKSTGQDKLVPVEAWGHEFAAELLVPIEELRRLTGKSKLNAAELTSIARYFNVGLLIILLRLRNNGMIGKDAFDSFWQKEKSIVDREFKSKRVAEESCSEEKHGGPAFCTLVISRFGEVLIRALCRSTIVGDTLYRDAMRLIGVNNPDIIDELHEMLQKAE